MNCNKDVSMKLFTSQLPFPPPKFQSVVPRYSQWRLAVSTPQGRVPDMGKRLVLPVLVLLATLCLPGGPSCASRQPVLSTRPFAT